MRKLIYGELYRLLHKKSMYIYFAAILTCYFLLAFVRSGGFTEEAVAGDAMTLFRFFPALAGGFFFTAIYTDDLNAKNLITLVGYGLGKAKIVLAKGFLMMMVCVIFFAFLPLFHFVVYVVLGSGAAVFQMGILYGMSLKFMLMSLAYAALSGIVVYGSQRSTFAVVTYMLLAFGVVATLLTAIFNVVDLNLYDHLLSGITDRIMASLAIGGSMIWAFVEYAVYIVSAIILSIVVFYKKEMEF